MANTTPEATHKKLRRIGKMLNALAAVSPSLAGRLAFRMFCTPRRQPVREKDRGFLSSATQDVFRVEGLSIQRYTWEAKLPDAPTVLFLHGWESNAARWHKYIRAARAAGFRVQAFDAPASGLSDGQLLNVLLYSRTIRKHIVEKGAPFAMVGHSLGAAAAVMSLTILGASRPKKLVVMASFAESTRVLRGFAQFLGANEKVVQALFKFIERRNKLPMDDYSVRRKAAELTDVEGLVMHDLNDEVAPVAEGLAIAESWGCRFVQTEGLGHRMQDHAVVESVMAFLQEGR